MILGNLNNLGSLDYLHPKFKEVLNYLKENNLEEAPCGQIQLQGKDLFINIEENDMAPKEKRLPEAHKRYLDIQVVLSGREGIGVSIRRPSDSTIKEIYSEDNDIMFFTEVQDEIMVDLKPMDFVILFSEDIHRPRCLVDEGTPYSKKAIVKMNLDLLK